MATAEVVFPFYVEPGGHIYEPGETFEGTAKKIKALEQRGLVKAAKRRTAQRNAEAEKD